MRAERIPQIIQAAMVVFARNGFAQTRMEDIAQEAGLSKATLYLYFVSKEEVITAILQTFFDQGFAELTTLRETDSLVSNKLVDWTRRRMREMQQQAVFLSIGFEFHAVAARHEATRQVVQRYYHQYRTSLAALIQQGIDRGELHGADAHELAIAILSVYEGLTVLWMLDPAAIDLVGVAERTVQALLRGGAKAA
jgi:AcrR family transcriptional regulator